MIILLFSKMPVGFVMALLGFVGFSYVVSLNAGLSLLARDVFETFSSYNLTVMPLFIFMGQVAFHSGISQRLYNAVYVLMGHYRGGLAIATIGACAGFSAISGSTNATAATMAMITLPEMRRYKYDLGLATGTVAAGGSLGILIPPSVIFIIYGIMTEQSIGQLFAAGILPGILLALLFILVIYLRVRLNPALAPQGSKTTLREKARSFTGVLETLLIFALVMGGLFFGIFTPTEAAAVGAFLTLLLAVVRRQLTWKRFVRSLVETTKISCMVMIIVTGAVVFGHFMAITRIPFDLANWVSSLPLPNYAIMGVIVLVYLFGGCFMDALAMIMLTIPIFYPVATSLGFHPIWFGVAIVLVTEMGVITPPVGVNVYVVHGIAKDIPLEVIFKGVAPFILALLACITILLAFPQIVLFLPGLMQ
ncbi:TRAP transporter large permease subunit [candidate division KSB3 bacterium]|uniref:TRAP transporter large permease subunit n=1 Tax=candidate division KSB3 bacterium TaxID=2044937 RepID=A0A9D5JW26_9BACT|nr:TRAP transporter large permease subunit [candidate division KSB3 bacterium]MBD3325189.1 TRAP transporter large permease subunit [candidate division KSB3 bacterium]